MVKDIANKMLAWNAGKSNCPYPHHLKPLCVKFEYLTLTSPSSNIKTDNGRQQCRLLPSLLIMHGSNVETMRRIG